MKKLLLILVVGLVVATGASYFGLQWKVKQTVDEFFEGLFFVDASYGEVTIGLDGQIKLSDIDLYVPATQMSVTVGSVGVETGSLLETLQFDRNIDSGKLPAALKLNISSFSMDIDSQFIDAMDVAYQAGTIEQMLSLGCGRKTSIGPKELFDMGLRNLTFDLSMGYDFDAPSDEFVSTVDFYLDGIGHIVMDQTFMGLGGIMENYASAITGFDPTSVTAVDMSFQYVDLGYNAKMQDYCAKLSGMDKAEWIVLNRSMVAAAIDGFDLETDFDVIKLYADLMDERSRFNLNLRPLPGFNAADLQFYEISKLIELLDLKLIVNNESVDVGQISWNQNKYLNLDLSALRSEYRIGSDEESPAAAKSEEANSGQERILKVVPISDLEKYAFREVYIERKDGKVFTGEMTSVSPTRIIIRTRFRSGYTDLPLVRSQIKEAKLYPEN